MYTLLNTIDFALLVIQYIQNALEKNVLSPYRVIVVNTTHKYKKGMQQSPHDEVGTAKITPSNLGVRHYFRVLLIRSYKTEPFVHSAGLGLGSTRVSSAFR